MATLNIETKLASLEAEKILIEAKIKDLTAKRADLRMKLDDANKRKMAIEILITELSN